MSRSTSAACCPACSFSPHSWTSALPASLTAPNLILVTQAREYVHDVIERETGPCRVERVFEELARRTGLFQLQWTDDVSTLTAGRIRQARVIVFYTTGELPLTTRNSRRSSSGSGTAAHSWGSTAPPTRCWSIRATRRSSPRSSTGIRGTPDAVVTIKVHEPDWEACKPFGMNLTLQEEIYHFRDFDPQSVRLPHEPGHGAGRC